MSTKTLRKRIALVAVSALGAGLLSVSPAFAGETAAGTDGYIHVSGAVCGATSLIGGTPTTADGTTDTSPYESGSTGGKIITVPLGASLKVQYDAADKITMSGPLSIASLIDAAQTPLAATVTTTNGKTIINGNAADSDVTLSAVGVGTATLVVDASTADATPTAANTIKVNIVASCTTSTFSAANSFVSVEDTSIAAADNVDASAAQADTESGFLSIVAKNQYAGALPSDAWIVNATNGAHVAIASGGAAAATTTGLSTAVVTSAGADIRVAVKQATEGVASSSVVTVSYAGTVVATRTFTWTGDLAKIEVSSVSIGKTGAQNHNSFTVHTYDAAGNQISWPNASLTISGADQNVTAADAVATATAAAETDATNDGNYFTCGAGAKGSTNLTVEGVSTALTTIKSVPFVAKCASSASTWTVAMDKTSYVPGDVATVTITAKDSNGNLVNDAVSNNGADDTNEVKSYVYGGAATAPVVSGSNLTAVVAPAAGDYFASGVKTYKFIVGSTEGSYQLAVELAGITTDSAKTVAYKISSGSASVTNAQVLAAIVKLIASINKQILALQKALKK